MRREIEAVRAEKDAELVAAADSQAGLESQRACLQREVESLRAELALREERSQVETESLRAQVQRLTLQPRATPPEASKVQVSVLSCHWFTLVMLIVVVFHFITGLIVVRAPVLREGAGL